MLTVDATIRAVKLELKQPVDFPDETPVRVIIQPISSARLTVARLNDFLRSLPSLGDDAEQFSMDIVKM